jgi:ATP-dependent RNA helicase DeaD
MAKPPEPEKLDPTDSDAEAAASEAEVGVTFSDFGLDKRIVEAIGRLGFERPTPIQAEAIPKLLEGHAVIGRARTGSGKTAAFAIPALERIKDGAKGPRVLVLAPTRELALQVTDATRVFATGLPVRIACIYGGASYTPQLQALRSGAQFIVATPGRLLDHMERGSIDLSGIEVLILDEADEMLRMGFIDAVEEVFKATPDDRQVCLFSATMPDEIRRVAETHIKDYVEVQVESSSLSVGHIAQQWIMVPQRRKVDTLVRLLGAEKDRGTTLVFARTRRSCAEVADLLSKRGVSSDALHGDLNQSARERVLNRMRSGQLNVVIATDVASRGIDVEHITHVINFDLPRDVEIYVHRIGRTGRAGRSGKAISFVTKAERFRIKTFQRVLKTNIENVYPPTDRDVAVQQREALKRRMSQSLTGDLTEVRAWLEEMRQEGWTDADLAASAVQIVTDLEGHDLRAIPQRHDRQERLDNDRDEREPRRERTRRDPEPRFDKGPTPGRSGGHDEVNQVEIFLATGREYGVRPGDLVGCLANELGIPGNRIGRVTILERKSFVGLPRDVAEAVLAERDSLEIRGHKVHISKAHGRPDGPMRDNRGGPGGGRDDRRGGRPPNRAGQRPFKPKGKHAPKWRR